MIDKKRLLPFDNTNPVIYENDEYADIYTDEYLFSLASSGEINLKGLITTISFTDSWQKPEIQYMNLVNGRKGLVGKARRSGMRNIPDPVEGPSVSLIKPQSGKIEDTPPINTPGSRLIVEEAKKAEPEKPLVIIMGGQSTVVADAYLLDNSIVEKVVVAWLVGAGENDLYGYNGWVDPWGTYIIISKLKTVSFGPVFKAAPFVPKQRLFELPDTELRQYMIEKSLPHVNLPAEHDFDAQPAIPIMRPDYVKTVVRKSFSHFDKDGMSLLKDDNNGNIIVVTEADKEIATEEWWRAMNNPAVYGGKYTEPDNSPYNGEPINIPGILSAAEFDFGGEGIAYHCNHKRHGSIVLKTAFRMTEHISFEYSIENKGEYIVEPLEVGEWLEYTVKIQKSDIYRVEVTAASAKCGGIFHLDFNGQNKSGLMEVPETGGWQQWAIVTVEKVYLTEGINVIRLTCDSGMFTLKQLEIT